MVVGQTIKALVLWIAFLPSLCVPQQTILQTAAGSVQPASAGCAPPTGLTHRWTAWNLSNTCTGGCSGTNTVTTLADTVGAINETGTGTYAASALNGYAGVTMNGAGNIFSNATGFTKTSTSSAPQSVYVIWKPTSLASTNVIVGNIASTAALEWGLTTTNGYQFLNSSQTVAMFTGTATTKCTVNTYCAILIVYASGTVTTYRASGGTYASESGSSSTQFTNAANALFYSLGDGYGAGVLVDLGYSNTALSPSQFANFSQCFYAH